MTTEPRILSLIEAYLAEIEAFRRVLNEETPLEAYRSGRLPKRGSVGADPEFFYEFHGVGCRVEVADRIVDFDFGPGGRSDGFDRWRLLWYSQSRSEKFGEFHSLETIQSELQRLTEKGIISCPNWSPSPHLYYLKEGCSRQEQR